MDSAEPMTQTRLVRIFSAVERWGQKLPDPLTLFAGMALLVVLFPPYSKEPMPKSFNAQVKSFR